MPVSKCQNVPPAASAKCGASPVRRVVLGDKTRPYYCHDCEARLIAAGEDVRSAATRSATKRETAAETAAKVMAERLGEAMGEAERIAWKAVDAETLHTIHGAARRRFGAGAETYAHGVDNAIDAYRRSIVRRIADRLGEVPSTVGLAAQWVMTARVVETKRGERITPAAAALLNATRRKAMLGRIDGIMAGGTIPWERPDGTVSRSVRVAVDGSGRNGIGADRVVTMAETLADRCDAPMGTMVDMIA